MDWIDEKILNAQNRIKNMSLKKALLFYILIFSAGTFVLSMVTRSICSSWILAMSVNSVVYNDVYSMLYTMPMDADWRVEALKMVNYWAPYLYALISMLLVSLAFYHKRIRTPMEILQNGVRKIKSSNLQDEINYDSEDEMGHLCRAMDEMRLELVRDKEQMWAMLEEKQRVNAAFAHDMRNPLTVLRGYSDMLLRYLPEKKVSEEKLMKTLEMMSEHLVRLERYTNTMKDIDRLDEVPLSRVQMKAGVLEDKVSSVVQAMNDVKMAKIHQEPMAEEQRKQHIWIDEDIALEVLENLISNAVRYADNGIAISMEIDKNRNIMTLFVKDDGQGFSGEALKKATQPYYRAEEKKQGSHFGIGLHVVKTLCEKHKGYVSLANGIEGGAVVGAAFWVGPL